MKLTNWWILIFISILLSPFSLAVDGEYPLVVNPFVAKRYYAFNQTTETYVQEYINGTNASTNNIDNTNWVNGRFNN